jgi:hypothetical protein
VVFVTFRGQPWHYRLSQELHSITHAEPCPVLNSFPAGCA